MIQAGRLTETLSFYNITETQSISGYKSETETFLLTCKAERMKNKENYIVDAGEIFHSVELSFRLRYRAGIVDTSIVKYEGEKYRIISLDKFPLDNEIVIKISKVNE